MIRKAGGRATVIALEDAFSGEDRAGLGATPLLTAPVIGPKWFGFAPQLRHLLSRADPDVVHLHDIWMYPSRAASHWARVNRRPYMVSPHGMLDPWITSRGRWKKALARRAYERRSWAIASVLHALTKDEATDIRHEAGQDTQVVVIPNAALSRPRATIAGQGAARPDFRQIKPTAKPFTIVRTENQHFIELGIVRRAARQGKGA
jgi:poly(glycerol-phosphate) alpha-glucosyltransferase